MTQAVNRLLQELAAAPEMLDVLTVQPQQLEAVLGFSAEQVSALRSADELGGRPMRPVTFTTGTTISV